MTLPGRTRRPATAVSEGSWIPLSSVSVTQSERSAVATAVGRGALSGTGREVAVLEAALAELTGRAHAVATNSGTSGLELALSALGLDARDEVLVPAFTFAAPASAIVNAGLTPIICDVDPETWTISTEECRKMSSGRTRAIVAVDVMGNPCDYDALGKLGLAVIEDAAESFGSCYRGQRCGGLGAASVLSLHANKTVSAGEGGMVLTDDAALANRVRLLANHGMSDGYFHAAAGHNMRMPNLTAAFATAQVLRASELCARRDAIQLRYREGLSGLPLSFQQSQAAATASTWLVAFRSSQRDGLVQHLRANQIDARAVWPSLSNQPFLSRWRRRTPIAERLADEVFWLPTYHDLPNDAIDRVISSILSFFERRLE